MSGTIWLIAEDENDIKVVKAILSKRQIHVRVEWVQLTGGSGGIGRLRNQLEKLIKTAFELKSPQDCIAVLHDADIHKQPNREVYNQIAQLCKKHKVKHVVANDELESWLLSDSGIANWLKIKHENWDTRKSPSDELHSRMQKEYKLKYQGRGRNEVLEHLEGNILSPSFQAALAHLENAPCAKP